jgi:hypothetical protein
VVNGMSASIVGRRLFGGKRIELFRRVCKELLGFIGITMLELGVCVVAGQCYSMYSYVRLDSLGVLWFLDKYLNNP